MDRSAALTIIKNRLGNIQGTAHDSLIVTNMQLVQETVMEGGDFKPWFLRSLDQALVTITDTRDVATPTGFLEEIESSVSMWYLDSDGAYNEVEKEDFFDLRDLYGVTEGSPKKYALSNESFQIFPLPDAVYNLRLDAYVRDTALTTNIENNWLKYGADWVIAETARQTAMDLQYQKLGQNFEQDSAKARARLYVQHVSREEAGRTRKMGDS